MKRLAALVLGLAVAVSLPLAALAQELAVKPSAFSVKETLDRLSEALKAKDIAVVARVDHAAGAEKVGTKLRPSEVMIFGHPRIGTPLIAAKRTAGIDLPLRALAWEDDKGKVWLAYVKPGTLRRRHGLNGQDAALAAMAKALDGVTDEATKKR